MPSFRSRLVAASVVTFAPLVAVVAAAPAHADTMSFYKSSGRVATAHWEDFEETESGFTSSFGSLYVEDLGKGEANVFGYIFESSCETAEEEWDCEYREIEVIGDDADFAVNKKLSSASLAGTLSVYDYVTGETDTISVNLTWTAVGGKYTETHSFRYRDESTIAMGRYRFTGRQAEVAGTVGDIDLSGMDLVGGELGSYRVMDRVKTK